MKNSSDLMSTSSEVTLAHRTVKYQEPITTIIVKGFG